MMTDKEIEQLINISQDMIRNKKTVEEILAFIRSRSGSKGVSIIVISKLLNISGDEAKILVHRSKVWNDVKDRDEKFHEEVFSAIEEIDEDE